MNIVVAIEGLSSYTPSSYILSNCFLPLIIGILGMLIGSVLLQDILSLLQKNKHLTLLRKHFFDIDTFLATKKSLNLINGFDGLPIFFINIVGFLLVFWIDNIIMPHDTTKKFLYPLALPILIIVIYRSWLKAVELMQILPKNTEVIDFEKPQITVYV